MAQESMFPDLNAAYMEAGSSEPAVKYKLYDSSAVAVATLLGGPISGAVLMALNYRRLGRMGAAMGTIGLGIMGMGLGILAGYLLPRSASFVVPIVLIAAMREIAQRTQGELIEDHTERGGELGSMVMAVGVGLAILIPILVAIFLPLLMEPHNLVRIGEKDVVAYSGQATRQDAQDLGDELKRIGYLRDQGAEVLLDKDKDEPTISFMVVDGWWDKPGAMSAAEDIARQVAKSVGGLPVRVRLVDTKQQERKTGSIAHLYLGHDEVRYYDDATPAEATALGTALQHVGQFGGNAGETVTLRKRDGTREISYEVGPMIEAVPGGVERFEKMTRTVAPSIGGLPVTMRLVTSSMEIEKEEVVQ